MGKNKKRAAPAAAERPSKKKAKTALSIADIPRRQFEETPAGDERKREANLYELLSSIDETDRKDAADHIVSGLLGGNGVEAAPEPVLERHLKRRLLRGLSSSRKAARVGFSLVLTEILHQLYGDKDLANTTYTGLPYDSVWESFLEQTEAMGDMAGQEERDHSFGRLFGMYAFVRSTALFLDPSRWEAALDVLLNLGHRKSWMRSQCGFTIVEALRQMDKAQTRATLKRVAEKGQAKTPEGVAIWLAASSRFPDLSEKPWGHPLSNKSLTTLAAVLKENYQQTGNESGDEGQTKKQGGWTKDPHFVWDLMMRYYTLDELASVADFERFWVTVIEDGFYSKRASDGQKFSGFMIFQKLLAGFAASKEPLSDSKLQCLFSPRLLDCLMNQASHAHHFVHRAAIQTLKAVEEIVSTDPALLPLVLERLLGAHGTYEFDQRTNTKTIDRLLRQIGHGNEEQVLQAIRKPLSSVSRMDASEADDGDVKHARQMIRAYIEYLSKSLNALALLATTESATQGEQKTAFLKALKELATLAYSTSQVVPASLLTDSIREMCQTRLESSLAKLARMRGQHELFCQAVTELDPGSDKMDAEIATAKKEALKRMKKLLKRKGSEEAGQLSLSHSLAILHAVSIFRLYNEDPDAMEVLMDLAEQTPDAGAENAEGDSEVLVETLLSMVTRPSKLMREVSHQVFGAFTEQMSEGGLSLLTEPLVVPENLKGQKALFSTEDEDAMEADDVDDGDDGSSDTGDEEEEEDDDESVEDVEDDSDVEIDGNVRFNGLDEEGDVEEEEDSDDEESEEVKKEAEDLDKLLGGILGSHRLDQDDEAEASGSDEDMSDSEMLALDEKLVEVFKQRRKVNPDNTKKAKREARQTVVNFKNRILDLLDIYVKNEAADPLALQALLPLLTMIRTTTNKPLRARGCNVISSYKLGKKKRRGRSGKGKGKEGQDAESLLALLKEIHEEARRTGSQAHASAASTAGVRVASAIVSADKDMHESVISLYSKTLAAWKPCKERSTFQSVWNTWVPPSSS